MRSIQSNIGNLSSFYKDMISGTRRSADFLPLEEDLLTAEEEYEKLAVQSLLYTYPTDNEGKYSIKYTNITKEDIISLYTYYMVRSKGRVIYDRILSLAENGKCPYCGQRNVRTLDHFLPKSRYPMVAINPSNLIPCCSDCNKDKKDSSINKNSDLIIHPYFDSNVDSTQWLFCVITTIDYSHQVITMNFQVRNVTEFDLSLNERISNHFSLLN